MAFQCCSEYLEIDLPALGEFKFTALTSYYLLHSSPLVNYPRLSELSWDRKIKNSLSKYGPVRTVQFKQALRDLDISPHNFLPLMKNVMRERGHRTITISDDIIVID